MSLVERVDKCLKEMRMIRDFDIYDEAYLRSEVHDVIIFLVTPCLRERGSSQELYWNLVNELHDQGYISNWVTFLDLQIKYQFRQPGACTSLIEWTLPKMSIEDVREVFSLQISDEAWLQDLSQEALLDQFKELPIQNKMTRKLAVQVAKKYSLN